MWSAAFWLLFLVIAGAFGNQCQPPATLEDDNLVFVQAKVRTHERVEENWTGFVASRSRFNTNEHINVGDLAFDAFMEEVGNISDQNILELLRTFSFQNDSTAYLGDDRRDLLKFGDFIYLSGDFYTDFQRTDGQRTGEGIPGIQADMVHEALGTFQAESNSWTGKKSLHRDLNHDMDWSSKWPAHVFEFVRYVRGVPSTESESLMWLTFYSPNWLEVTAMNYDHFGEWARKEFIHGHKFAWQEAFKAGQLYKNDADPACSSTSTGHCSKGWLSSSPAACPAYSKASCLAGQCVCGKQFGKSSCAMGKQCHPNPEAWTGKLREAIEVLGMSEHFYTDLFAAGHQRVPYVNGSVIGTSTNIHDWCTSSPSKVVGLVASCMHTEDNEQGLFVRNALGDEWTSYGDSKWFTPENARNRELAIAGVRAALLDVWRAFQDGASGKAVGTSALGSGGATDPLAYLPEPTPENKPPLIRAQNGKLELRGTDGTYSTINACLHTATTCR